MDKTGLSRLWSKIKGAFLPKVGTFRWTREGDEGYGYVAFGGNGDADGLSGDVGISVVGDDKVQAAVLESDTGIVSIRLLDSGYNLVVIDAKGIHIDYSGTVSGVGSDDCTIHFIYNNKTYGFDVEGAIRAGILMEE